MNSFRETIIQTLRRLGIEPKKSLGQNFLMTESIYHAIVEALDLVSTDTVVEVGPGLGTLTQFLADKKARVIAIEKDTELTKHLRKKFTDTRNITIEEGDILEWQPTAHNLKAGEYKVVGNIPYYLTSHLLRIIFESWPTPQKIVVMIQKEVAQRIIAKPPAMSLLAVSIQYFANTKIIRHVPAGNFYPSPDVESSIIALTPHAITRKVPDALFFKVARAGFSEKRKQILNNLSRELHLDKNTITEILTKSSIDPKRRAETLTIEEWQRLTEHILPRL